jgi:hypothetical protein
VTTRPRKTAPRKPSPEEVEAEKAAEAKPTALFVRNLVPPGIANAKVYALEPPLEGLHYVALVSSDYPYPHTYAYPVDSNGAVVPHQLPASRNGSDPHSAVLAAMGYTVE